MQYLYGGALAYNDLITEMLGGLASQSGVAWCPWSPKAPPMAGVLEDL